MLIIPICRLNTPHKDGSKADLAKLGVWVIGAGLALTE